MKNFLTVLLTVFTLGSFAQRVSKPYFVIGRGQMPNVTMDRLHHVHIVYGSGDSIFYTYSKDNAKIFAKPSLVTVLPKVYTFATRGPQIAATKNGLVITAVTSNGNIHSFYKTNESNRWTRGKGVNDVNDIAKEGLTGLSADGDHVVAVWLDLRNTNRNKIYSARSIDGGKSWLKNILVYASPDSTVCECCKPSVIIKDDNVYVMFRNWLNGNRDLYLAKSRDGGKSFNKPFKLGNGSWRLKGCPMDGGGMAVNSKGDVQSVWQREGKIYAAMPGKPEKEIGEGRSCTMENINNKILYTWTEKGAIIILHPQGRKQVVGKGSHPIVKALNNESAICVWENEKQIHASIIQL